MSEQMQAEIAALNAEIDREEDPRWCVAKVRARISELRQAGEVVPADLIRMQHNLEVDCICQSRGG